MVEWDRWSGEPGEINVIQLGRAASVEDLRRTKLKAELIDGRLVVIGPSAAGPGTAALNVLVSLHQHRKRGCSGQPLGSRVAFIVDLPHRQALCPDASWYTGDPSGEGFLHGAPVFAAEIRDGIDYGPTAERRLAQKRADYFVAGTRVVWDVDVLREQVVRVYRADDPQAPGVYRRGEVAEAEPAVPGWRFPVDELFD